MKLSASAFFAAASGGLFVSASQLPAEVYIFETHPNTVEVTPKVPKEVARHIFVQRAARDPYGNSLEDFPSIDEDTAIGYIATYGKNPAPLFQHDETTKPSHLLVILEGVTDENGRPLRQALVKTKQKPAFEISNPPSYAANKWLFNALVADGVSTSEKCDLSSAINPFDVKCWSKKSAAIKYDVQREPEIISTLVQNLERLSTVVAKGNLETTLVLMPESSRNSKSTDWALAKSGYAMELLARGEALISTLDRDTDGGTGASSGRDKASSWAQDFDIKTRARAIPQCFQSFNTCMNQTGGCTGHGECANRFGNSTDAKMVCFTCACKPTWTPLKSKPRAFFPRAEDDDEEKPKDPKGTVTYWGGAMCQKQDVSTPFWLLVGSVTALAAIVSFSIGLLFSVGQEPLPGVIGAGVSKSK